MLHFFRTHRFDFMTPVAGPNTTEREPPQRDARPGSGEAPDVRKDPLQTAWFQHGFSHLVSTHNFRPDKPPPEPSIGHVPRLFAKRPEVGLLKLRASRPAGSRSFSQALAPSIPGENVEATFIFPGGGGGGLRVGGGGMRWGAKVSFNFCSHFGHLGWH